MLIRSSSAVSSTSSRTSAGKVASTVARSISAAPAGAMAPAPAAAPPCTMSKHCQQCGLQQSHPALSGVVHLSCVGSCFKRGLALHNQHPSTALQCQAVWSSQLCRQPLAAAQAHVMLQAQLQVTASVATTRLLDQHAGATRQLDDGRHACCASPEVHSQLGFATDIAKLDVLRTC